MARRRPAEAPTSPATPRRFTEMELAQIRRILTTWEARRTHPHPGADELREIFRAAGRNRPPRYAWELDYVDDPDYAYAQEIQDEDSPDRWEPYTPTWWDLHPPTMDDL
ncbi:MAG: hypothetical protein H0U51_00830 [Propionibacteriales bacterium]|nr:hypothetical protein [Propionibacteriales bacterium]